MKNSTVSRLTNAITAIVVKIWRGVNDIGEDKRAIAEKVAKRVTA